MYVHFLIAVLFLEREMFPTKFVEKIRLRILGPVTSPPLNSCPLWDNVKKLGRARQATDDNIIERMRIASWVPKTTETHSEYTIRYLITALPLGVIIITVPR